MKNYEIDVLNIKVNDTTMSISLFNSHDIKYENDIDKYYDEIQASVAHKNNDQHNDKGWIPQCAKKIKLEKLDILGSKSTLTLLSLQKNINGSDTMEIVIVVKLFKSVQLTTRIVKSYNHTSNKSVNETLPSTYLMWIPKQNKQNEPVVIIKIACLKSSVQHRARIKEDVNTSTLRTKLPIKERQCYEHKNSIYI